MKTRFFASLAALVALFLLPIASHAQTTITTLLSETFGYDESFPPDGWSADYEGEYNYYYGGWWQSDGGNGGAGGTYGSAVASTCYTYQPGCYTGFNDGKINLTFPAINTGSLPATDSIYLDFDLWFPEGYYQTYLSPYQEDQVQVLEGTTALLTKKSPGDCVDAYGNTFYTGGPFTDPDEYTSSQYWRHFHVYVPNGGSTTQLSFHVADNGGYCYYGFMYCENVAFTNVVVTSVHHPILTVNGPTTINFGTVPVGQSDGPYYTVLSNSNEGPISISNYAFSGVDPGDFTIVRAPSVIPAGGKDSVGIVYSPTAPGARSAFLSYNSNAIPATIMDTLYGQGVVAAVSYSATNMFRGVNTEVTKTSAPRYLYVNSIGGIPLKILSASFIGLDASAYSISHLPAGPIPPGGIDSIGVVFTPDLEGVPDAHMVINSNAPIVVPWDTVSLYGVGILPHLSIDNLYPNPITVNFDSVKLGQDTCLTVMLTNPGSDTIAIVKNYFKNADFDFSITPLSGSDTLIPPGGSQNIQVCFTPLQQGYRLASLEIQTNIPPTQTVPPHDTSSFVVNFVGTGVPSGDLLITGPSTNGNALIGNTACVTDTFWNTGAASLTITNVAISGANGADFGATLNPPVPFVLAAQSHQTFTVCATPSQKGAEAALLTATANSNESPLSATLPPAVFGQSIRDTGIVVTPFAADICIGDSGFETISITNTGNVPESYSAAISGGTNAADFSVSPASSGTEQPGDIATFLVTFVPTTNAAETATLAITNGEGHTIALSANGGAATITGTGSSPLTTVNTTSQPFAATVTNSGTCEWTTGTPVVSLPFTYVSGATTIAPGTSAQLMFTFTPTSATTATQTVGFPTSVGTSLPAANVVLTGNATTAGVAGVAESNGYSLDQNYPNPFSGSSEFSITLPVGGLVNLNIINVEGQVVQTVLNQHFDAGTFGVTLKADGLASGTYYYQMVAGGVTLTRQMVIVK
jgi:hypothetical protein